MISDRASEEETGRIYSKRGIKEPRSPAPAATFAIAVSGIKRQHDTQLCRLYKINLGTTYKVKKAGVKWSKVKFKVHSCEFDLKPKR